MATKRKQIPRPIYRDYDEQAANAAIKAAIPVNGDFWRYLDEERKTETFGANEWERGIIEGARRFAGRLQDIAMAVEEE